MPSNFPDPSGAGPARFIGAVFGIIFCGIGLTVLGSLWLSTGMDSPPMVFKLFGSFIAIGFVAMGGGMAYAMIFKRPTSLDSVAARAIALRSELSAATPGNYTCPHCAAPLQDQPDVSPCGDVKCAFCNSWFNVHNKI